MILKVSLTLLSKFESDRSPSSEDDDDVDSNDESEKEEEEIVLFLIFFFSLARRRRREQQRDNDNDCPPRCDVAIMCVCVYICMHTRRISVEKKRRVSLLF